MEAGVKDDCIQRASYFQKIRGDEMLAGVRLRWPVREALPGVPPPTSGCEAPRSLHTCVCVYVVGQRGVFEESGWNEPKQPTSSTAAVGSSILPTAGWAAAGWQGLEEGFHHARLLLLSPLWCQGLV